MSHMAVCQKWEESERGWGTRPDGYSLHATEEDRKRYIAAYWAARPAKVPVEYSRPYGTAFSCSVDEKTWDEIVHSECGIRRFRGMPPDDPEIDGWCKL